LTTQPNLRKLPYSADSFDYVCRVYANPQVLLVRKDSPYKSVMDLIADARANPGKLTYASTGTGSVPHLALAALASATGTKMVHVPYKGDSDSLLGVLSGDITMFVSHSTLLSTHGDKVRGLAVLAPTRLKEFPDLPTVAEQGGPALNFEVWGGVTTAKGTPPAALAALDQACRTATQSEGFRKQLETMNTPVHYMDGKTFGAFVKSEFERNGRLLREAGIERAGSGGEAPDWRPGPSDGLAPGGAQAHPATWWAPRESNPAPTDYETKTDRRWGRESRRSATTFSTSHRRLVKTERIPNLSSGSAAFRTGKSKRINGVRGGGPNRFRTVASAARETATLDSSRLSA
jgi:hypothetical protein